MITGNIHAFWLALTCDLLDDKHMDDVTIKNIFFFYPIKQIDSMLLQVCTVINQRRRENVVKTLDTLGCV